jgi:3-hydroxyacyl-[acyl-carrier-protein] dehydratase
VCAADGDLELEAIDSTRFKSPVFPGDAVTIDAVRDGAGVNASVSSERGTAAELRLRFGTARPPAAGVEDVLERLPHRYPMLLVDRITDVEPGSRLTAIKAVTCNEPWFGASGHEDPHLPSVLLVESWCQAAGVLAAWDTPNPDVTEGSVMLFGSIAGLRFHGRVQPGDVVEHQVRIVRALSDTVIVEGESRVGSRTVLEVGRVVMALRPAEALTGARS